VTVDKLTELAQGLLVEEDTRDIINGAHKLARGALDLLAESDACGWESPRITSSGYVAIPSQWRESDALDPGDAREWARMLLRAADQADASAAEGTVE
jgi:hypothetical protein